MPSYLITGASRGLGVSLTRCCSIYPTTNPLLSQFGFIQVLSSNRKNTVIGLVRNKAATEEKLAEELGSSNNVYILEADITDYHALKVEALTQGIFATKLTRV